MSLQFFRHSGIAPIAVAIEDAQCPVVVVSSANRKPRSDLTGRFVRSRATWDCGCYPMTDAKAKRLEGSAPPKQSLRLPSFEGGLPVIINWQGQSITIDSGGVHARRATLAQCLRGNVAWLFKTSFDAGFAEYTGVLLLGTIEDVNYMDAGLGCCLTVKVELNKRDQSKNVILGKCDWNFDLDDFSEKAIQPLRRLAEEAATTLHLQLIEQGVLTEPSLTKAMPKWREARISATHLGKRL